MAVFYQKYRPQTFSDVIGQEPIVQTLRNAAEAGTLAHAYLFTGSRGVGKTTLARLLAKAANCQNLKKGDPCGKCDICLAVANNSSLDIIEIDAASHTGVDNVREFIEHAGFRPTSMTRKVFIIDEVHMLSKAAFNALLKTLEEPPEHVMFILATTDIEKVPATIVSRTQRFDFKKINPMQMAQALNEIVKDQKLKLPGGVVEAVVSQSEGSMRDALTRLDMVASLGGNMGLADYQNLLGVSPKESIQTLISFVLTKDSEKFPEFYQNESAKGMDFQVFNRSVLMYLRQLLTAKLTGKSQEAAMNEDGVFLEHVKQSTMPQLLFVIRLFLRSYKELNSSPSAELPMLLASIEASFYGNQAGNAVQPAPQTVSQPAPQVNSESAAAPVTEAVAEVVEDSKKSKSSEFSFTPPEEEQTVEISTDLTMEELNQWWPNVISRIKTENSPLATLLKNSPVVGVENGRITVAAKYLFHKEHFDNKKHQAIIAEAINSVCGKNYIFKSIIQNNHKETITQTVDALTDALKVFGGELVE